MVRMENIKRTILFILFIPLLPLFGVYGMFRFLFVDVLGYITLVNKNFNVLKNGVPASGKIASIVQTGIWDANNPVCRLQVTFLTKEGEKITADAVESIKITDMPAFQAGNYVAIKYNPNKKTEVAIDYN